MNTNVFIDVTKLKPELKHPSIFDAFDKIDEGETMVIQNDHDPMPLYYQLLGNRGNCFSWTYKSRGPRVWEIEIKKKPVNTNKETIGHIVSKDIRKAEVFKKYGIDFCCGGKKTLEESCTEKGISESALREELALIEQHNKQSHDFNSWTLSFLIDYIINTHHQYVTGNVKLLKELSAKVSGKHGDKYPELEDINRTLNSLLCELTTHLKKEEAILFPYIKMLENSSGIAIGFETIKDPIWVMESDHDAAGVMMHNIRKLSNGYTAPENACNSFKLLMYKLEEFENDLFQHIHLENNILFPKAIAIENKV